MVDGILVFQVEKKRLNNNLETNIKGNRDILGRSWMGTRIVPIDEEFPDEIVNNQDKYMGFIE